MFTTPQQRAAHHAAMPRAPRWYANLVFAAAFTVIAAGAAVIAVTIIFF